MKKLPIKILSVIMAVPFALTAVSCSAIFGKKTEIYELEYTEFPTQEYDVDKVHPVRQTGSITGDQALAELNEIEWSYIKHQISDDYVAANWCFRDLAGAGITIEKPSLGNVGTGDIRSECEYLTGLLEHLYKIDFESLEKEDRDFYDQIVFDIEEERYIKQYEGFYYMLPAIEAPSVGSFYLTVGFIEIRSRSEADLYIELLKDTDRYYDEVMAFEEERSGRGYASIEEYYKTCSNSYYMLTQESQTGPFRESFVEQINNIDGLTEDEINAYIEEFDKVMEEVVVPEFLECCRRIADLGGTNVNNRGLAGFEYGKEYYEHILRRQIGRSLDVEAIEKELEEVLAMEPESLAPTQIDGNNNQEMLDNMVAKAWDYFPEIDINYEIVKLPSLFKSVGISGVYAARYFDDPSLEIIFLPDALFTKEVVFHEGIPGHMYQYNYHKTHLKHIYLLAFGTNTYVEGWATYIMNNPAVMYGTTDDDRLIYTGVIYKHYMTLALVDILINYEGKTPKEASAYLSGISDDMPSINSDDMIMTPGIAISYGLGCYMTLKTLEAIRELDPGMDIKTMHTLYLDAGPGCFDRILNSVKREYEVN